MPEPEIAQKSPYMVDVEEGKKVAWCACGHSEKQPFCDGAHARLQTGIKPVVATIAKKETAAFCGCKHTKNPPYCDGTHKTL
ncbi:MAG: CDGSH iron-sulfur domain-containing protein [Leptospiraceae bacterium]|nr:CDGSH iron-sulfur domain-containing protein [Leptospiraceae bacterium]